MGNIPEPFITIGLPVFNGENHISDAIESILCQSFKAFKLIIADNCSTDNTYSIVESYKNIDSRISSVRHDKNIGGLSNLLFLTKDISTPYFMWFAHDDVLDRDFLMECLDFLSKNPQVDMAFSCIRNIDANGASVREYPNFKNLPFDNSNVGLAKFILSPELDGKANLIYSIYRSPILLRAIESNKDTLKISWGPDMAFLFAILASGVGIKILPRVLFNKRSLQPPVKIGNQLSIPSSYLRRSAGFREFSYLKQSYIHSIKKYKKPSLLIFLIYVRHFYLALYFIFKSFYSVIFRNCRLLSK